MTHPPPATSGTLRERLVADMAVRGFTEKTCKDYLRIVAGFAAFLERSPGRLVRAEYPHGNVVQRA